MSFNSKGRFYTRGKCLDKCVRGDIIDDILKAGVTVEQDTFLGIGRQLARSTGFIVKLSKAFGKRLLAVVLLAQGNLSQATLVN